MTILQIYPTEKQYDLDGLIAALKVSKNSKPFSSDIIDTCVHFSNRLLQDGEAKRYAELQALAFFMRKAALMELRQDYEKLLGEQYVLVPRGIVFHIPPANVDTIFVYSWFLSALAGNSNIIRLPTKQSDQINIICRLLSHCLSESPPAIKDSNFIISYGHDDNVTEAISQVVDVRAIWGGDATVGNIRRIPLTPHAKEIVFPNRYSYTIIRASNYLELNKKDLESTAHDFFNDAFWFDQLGCSSPRIVIWCGDAKEIELASSQFWQALDEEIRKQNHVLPLGNILSKIASTYSAVLDDPIVKYTRYENELTVLEIDSMEKIARQSFGMGLFYQFRVSQLSDIVPFVKKCDQTLTYFGFSKNELLFFAKELNGRGIDRIVPIGQSLSFNRFWDGYDLIYEFVKTVFLG